MRPDTPFEARRLARRETVRYWATVVLILAGLALFLAVASVWVP